MDRKAKTEKKNSSSSAAEQAKEKTNKLMVPTLSTRDVQRAVTVPMLPISMNKYLIGREDRIEDLISIKVEFFPTGVEVKYVVRDEKDGLPHESELDTAGFNRFLIDRKSKGRELAENRALLGLPSKLLKRVFINFTKEPTIEEMRRISAIKMPPFAERLMKMTQKEFNGKFPEEKSVRDYLSKLSDIDRQSLDSFQLKVDDTFVMTWTQFLDSKNQEALAKEKAKIEKVNPHLPEVVQNSVKNSVESSAALQEEAVAKVLKGLIQGLMGAEPFNGSGSVNWSDLQESDEVETKPQEGVDNPLEKSKESILQQLKNRIVPPRPKKGGGEDASALDEQKS